MIKAVIFDVGGVLKSETDRAIQRDIMDTLEISPEVFAEPWQILTDKLGRGAIPEDEFWKQMLQMTGAQRSLPSESLLMREYQRGHCLHEDVMGIISRLRKAGYTTAILSNTIASHAQFNRTHGVYDGFDAIILSHEVGLRKPSLEIFDITLAALGLAAEETVFVDDAEKNVIAAEKLGLHGILFTNAQQFEEQLQKLGLVF